MSSEALSKRLADEADRAQRKLLKQLGFEKASDAEAFAAAARAAADEKRTELERLTLQLAEAQKGTARAKELEDVVTRLTSSELARLPEKVRAVVVAKHPDNPQAQITLVETMREMGLLEANPQPPSPPAAPAQTGTTPVSAAPAAPANNGSTAPAPQPQQARTAYEMFIAKKSTDKFGADLFYQANKSAIEASRPADS